MLGNSILDDFTFIGNGIELDFLGLGHELRYHYRELLRHLGSHVEETMQFLFIVADVHGSAGEHIRRTNEDGIADLLDELLDILERGERTPAGLVDAEFVEHGRELVAVLGTVNVDR